MRSLGSGQLLPGGRGGLGGGGRRNGSPSQGLRQTINLNYNWSHSASDLANMFPDLGGKNALSSYSLQTGYTVGYHRFTSISNLSWNRSNGNTINYFTNTTNNPIADASMMVPNNVALNYGVPDISLSEGIQGLSETQPSFSISQTITFTEVLSWIHGKHNMRFGGDYRRVHRDFLAGSNAAGDFAFTGLFTQDAAQDPTTGSSFADFLLGLPQSTTLNSSLAKSYLRDNVVDVFAMDDWRMLPSFTLNYGVRWEFFAPYTEKFGRLADVATNPAAGFTSETEQTAGMNGLPGSLVFPWHKAFQPRVGLAWRVPKIKNFVVRAGFGTNYTVGEYAGFATTMAHQPPFTNEQTNQEAVGNSASSACALTTTCFTLANGFPAPAAVGNYALDPHYGLPYVMAWNLDIQKTLPWGIVMNVGYNGARSNHLDVKLAPRALPGSPATDPSINAVNPSVPCPGSPACQPLNFNYDEAAAYFKMNAGTVRVNKRLSHGVSLGANYQYGHSIDDATSVNGSSGSVVQNWQDLAAQEGHSVLDIRHQVSGTYLFELPFGPDGKLGDLRRRLPHPRRLLGFRQFPTSLRAHGSRPDSSPRRRAWSAATPADCGQISTGQSVTSGGGSLRRWFNPAAYQRQPTHRAFAITSAALRATPSRDRERSRTIWRSQKPCSSARRAAWRFAPRSTMS